MLKDFNRNCSPDNCMLCQRCINSYTESHEPELVFVDKDLRTVAEDNFNPYYYVIKAEDYRGKDINDKKHLV